jgi:hypothetical protein
MMSDRQILAARQTEDIKILQKVNAAHRDAFANKYPGQVEHCLRLTMERLQAGLDKRDGCDVSNPTTWRMSTQEIHDLAHTAHLLDSIRRGF